MTVVVAASAAMVPWLAGKLSGRLIAAAFAAFLLLLAGAATPAMDIYPWSTVLVLGVALAGGVGLGRMVPALFLAWLLLLGTLSVLDIAKGTLSS